MPLCAPPNCRCLEAEDSTIRFTGRPFNSTQVRKTVGQDLDQQPMTDE